MPILAVYVSSGFRLLPTMQHVFPYGTLSCCGRGALEVMHTYLDDETVTRNRRRLDEHDVDPGQVFQRRNRFADVTFACDDACSAPAGHQACKSTPWQDFRRSSSSSARIACGALTTTAYRGAATSVSIRQVQALSLFSGIERAPLYPPAGLPRVSHA